MGISAIKAASNRRNAQRSTGPRTAAGKARSAQNARRHGLNRPAVSDPAWAESIAMLTRAIAGEGGDGECLALATCIAAAHIDVVRVRRAR
jgi:hypothetical protein